MKKQTADNATFARIWREAPSRISRAAIEAKADAAAREIRDHWAGRRVWFGWSGGKDSIALAEVCRRAKITRCVFGMTRLEYPAFLTWVTNHMPEDLEVYQTGLDLDWLARHPDMLFPQTAKVAAKWFKVIQHAAQAFAVHRFSLDAILLGRRREDGNYVGAPGTNLYESKGVIRHSPLADWSHVEVGALIGHLQLAMPPCYDWPNGFRVGTGCWPARQYTRSTADGWREVYAIDPSVVEQAACRIPSAVAALKRIGRSHECPV